MIDAMEKQDDERWLTPEDVAAMLKVHIKTVQRKLRNKEIKGYRFGVRWRIKPSDLQAYMDKSNT